MIYIKEPLSPAAKSRKRTFTLLAAALRKQSYYWDRSILLDCISYCWNLRFARAEYIQNFWINTFEHSPKSAIGELYLSIIKIKQNTIIVQKWNCIINMAMKPSYGLIFASPFHIAAAKSMNILIPNKCNALFKRLLKNGSELLEGYRLS